MASVNFVPGVPDYSIRTPSVPPKQPVDLYRKSTRDVRKQFWDYGIPNYDAKTARIGAPKYGLFQYYPPGGIGFGGAGNGGSRGGGGGGSGDNSHGDEGKGNPMTAWTVAFALLIGAGGLSAFLRKKSSQSLMASSAVAAALLLSASLMASAGGVLGVRLALGVVVALGVYMGLNYTRSGKPHALGISAACAAMGLGYIVNL
eukprot:CAMPEP_0177604522 /NCGR_PEP_ID=MMETSP0419_2-20121207/16167_1 /TAXON_ID=582737 /ORGANISM="Tetraselmis sp., Strain GSL018" /LENGTH=201 /DNA_ID=CAMNT_0019098519 /DNA_START=202 /DNA_END=807 /DNA_ORIENTATION=+